MRKPLLTLLATCLLVAAGAGVGWYLFAEPASKAGEVAAPRARIVPVETAIAEAGRAVTRVRATGTLGASDSVVVQPEIAGRVTAILFDQGEAVSAGTPMITLATETLQAELTMAEAALVLAQENYQRSEALSRRGATAAQALDEARAKLRTAEAEVDLAKCGWPTPRSPPRSTALSGSSKSVSAAMSSRATNWWHCSGSTRSTSTSASPSAG